MNIRATQYAARNKKLRALGFDSYQQYLSSDLWREIRAKFHERWDGRGCNCCGAKDRRLIPHHLKYKKVAKPHLSNIIPVCQPCHQGIHDIHRLKEKISIKKATERWIKRCAHAQPSCEAP